MLRSSHAARRGEVRAGVATTLPATVSASSKNHGSNSTSLTEPEALDFIANAGGVFYFGYSPNESWVKHTNLADHLDWYESGYSTNQIPACKGAAQPGVTHVGVCKLLQRADSTTGLFHHITVADWNAPDGRYFDAVAANWVERLGLTCDNPLALGHSAAGFNVAWGGKPDPNHTAGGVRASGFNNIYPYFRK